MRNIIILTFLLLFLLPGQGRAQLTKQQAKEKYERFNRQWKEKKLSTDSFLLYTMTLSAHLMRQQPVFSTDELRELLRDFREVAWSSDKYHKYRGIYFDILMTNADMSGKAGEAIFYAGKSAQISPERAANPATRLSVAYMKCGFYVQNGNYEKAIEEYEKITPRIDSLTNKKTNTPSTKAPYINALQISGVVVHAFVKKGNLAGAHRLMERAEQLYSKINVDTLRTTQLSRAMTNFIHIEIALAEKDYATAKSFLIKCDSIIKSNQWNSPFSTAINTNLTEWWLKYYLAIKDYPNAAHYLKVFDEGPHLYPNYASFIFQKKAELSVIKNDYKAAYAFMKKALESKNKNLVSVTNDMNNLLYAHAEAEFNKAQLASAEKARKKRVILFTGVGLGLLAIILILIILYRRAKTKADKRIAALNAMADFQIATAKEEAVKEEQDRLARDLHDNYSASIAGILNRLESVSSEATGTTWGKEIEELSRYIEIIYQSVRKKSHELFRNAQDQQSVQLEKSILRMMEIALPSRRFKKEIDVETTAVSSLPLSHQIEILRIVQECMANIVKHGKNADEVFLFIFRENGGVTLQIGDNGKTANAHTSEKNSQTLGMESIRKRVASMKGNMVINNDNGFTLAINIPD